jgi:hypothetical protein
VLWAAFGGTTIFTMIAYVLINWYGKQVVFWVTELCSTKVTAERDVENAQESSDAQSDSDVVISLESSSSDEGEGEGESEGEGEGEQSLSSDDLYLESSSETAASEVGSEGDISDADSNVELCSNSNGGSGCSSSSAFDSAVDT